MIREFKGKKMEPPGFPPEADPPSAEKPGVPTGGIPSGQIPSLQPAGPSKGSGLWPRGIKVVFLDRDGVINRYPGDKKYVLTIGQFKFLKGSLSAIKSLSSAGYRIFVVSNQAGVAKGLYSKKTLKQITDYMLNEVKKSGARINKVLYCTHLKEEDCHCRKPKDGLLKKAVGNRQVDLENSYFIGDSLMDVKAGRSFGCKTILVLSGREKLKNSALWDAAPDFIAKSLFDAARRIIGGGYNRA